MHMKLRIRELRKRKGLTIEQMADVLGMSKSHISEVENGKKNLSAPMMDKVADLFEVTVVQLYEADDMTEQLEAIADLLKGMSAEDRQRAVRLVASLKNP